DGAISSLGYDRRRFRPNLLVSGVAGLAEREWEGRHIHVGSAVIRIVSLRRRCIMTTFDPDTAEQDTEVLLRIHRELGGLLALGLGLFMASAGLFGTLLESPSFWGHRLIPHPFVRRALMGVLMGLTAVGLIYSPWGKRSGAHINPATTLTFLRLGKVSGRDAA